MKELKQNIESARFNLELETKFRNEIWKSLDLHRAAIQETTKATRWLTFGPQGFAPAEVDAISKVKWVYTD